MKISHIHIEDVNRFMCNKTKNKNRKHFCKYCLQCFSSKRVLVEHEETCQKINGKQTVKLKSSIKFKNHFKQLTVPFKIYADFESILKGVREVAEIIVLHILKSIRNTFLAVLLRKSYVLMINSASHLFFTEEKMQSIDL